KRFVATVQPITQTGRPKSHSAAERNRPSATVKPIVSIRFSVVPFTVTPLELRFLYLTGSSVDATAVTALESVSCSASESDSESVRPGRFCEARHSSYDFMNHEPRSTYKTSPPMNEMLF